MALLGRRRDWVRYQGRANAALFLLARDMEAQFIEPVQQKDFAGVRGRARGCTFEVRIGEEGNEPVVLLTARHFHSQQAARLDGPGCTVPELDPALMRLAIEKACSAFSTEH